MKHNWEYKKLGEIGKIITGNTPNTKDAKNYETNEICFVKPSDISGEGINYISNSEFHISKYAYENSRQLPKGSILTTCIGNIGKVAILEIEATCNQQINAIIPNKDIDSKFLAYSIISQRYLLQSMANAPVVPILNKTQFSNFSIPLPPLPTQQSIVSELDSLSQIIADCKETLKDYDALEQSIFYDMFGDPVKNDKGWEVKKLGDCCSELKYGTSRPACENGQYKYLRMGNLTLDGHLDLTDLKTIDIPDDEIDKCIVKYGDILFNRTNSMELIGKTCMFDLEEPMVIAGYIIRVRLLDTLNPRFLSIMFNLPSLKLRLKSMAKGAVNQANINSKELASIRVILPPLPLQQAFASKIEAIEQMKEETKKALQEAETLFQARMDYWFN